jgi:hypothetical protein
VSPSSKAALSRVRGELLPGKRKLGRPPRAAKASLERVEIRVTKAELVTWRREASKAGMTLSSWVRFRCDLLGTRYPVP